MVEKINTEQPIQPEREVLKSGLEFVQGYFKDMIPSKRGKDTRKLYVLHDSDFM